MDMRYPRTVCFLCAWLAISLESCLVASQKIGGKRGSSYIEWGEIVPNGEGSSHNNWTMCSYGKQQSPIDVNNVIVDRNLSSLNNNYYPSDAVMKKGCYEIKIEWINGGGSLEINGKRYILQQCHWHSPSEHTLHGKRYPLELHMVHVSSADEIAVIGILYETGRPDPFLTPELMEHLRRLIKLKEAEEPLGRVSPPLIPKFSPYYRYQGSLTTPPCTEGVVWTLLQQIRSVSQEQLGLLRAAVNWNFNARPLQPLHGRVVSLYELYKPGQPVEHSSY